MELYTYGAMIGGFIGSIVGLLIYRSLRQNKFQKIKGMLSQTTEVIFDGLAFRIAGVFPKEGWLFLTNYSLIFYKTSRRKIEIFLNSIQKIEKARIRLASGLIITTNQTREKITVRDNKMWLDLIEAQILKNNHITNNY